MWWEKEEYRWDDPLPEVFNEVAGPNGPALVRAWKDSTTDPGWGEDKFARNYEKHLFHPSRKLPGYKAGQHAVAYIMRSVRMVCIDIDGKNGGLVGARMLGALPLTLAETSKSGNGYHLYFLTEEDEWDEQYGYAMYRDRIGLVQGVDLRATGCVYHYPSQRWNDRDPVPLPEHVKQALQKQRQQVDAKVATIKKTLDAGEIEEVLLMQEELKQELAKPIPAGRRNNTLFAIGSQMFIAGVPDWAEALEKRALAVGLDQDETAKLIGNVQKYGAKAVSAP